MTQLAKAREEIPGPFLFSAQLGFPVAARSAIAYS